MTEIQDLCSALANSISTYRAGEIPVPSTEHAERWASQFSPENRMQFLREMVHVLGQTYLSREWVLGFLSKLSENEKLSSANPIPYWAGANFLRVQKGGYSQRDMLAMLGQLLAEKYKLDIDRCGSPNGDFIYLDDGIFSGSRVISDLTPWLQGAAPANANVQIIVIALHAGGFYWSKRRLEQITAEAGKKVTFNYWHATIVENRRTYRNQSNVLWPTEIPTSAEAQGYFASLATERFPFEPRTAGAPRWPFSSEEGRQVLEAEFLTAGARIKAGMMEDKRYFRPLGFSPFGVGFGSMIATYRNCPNNAPLALWWGDGGQSSAALNWYPLLPRKTYSDPEHLFDGFD